MTTAWVKAASVAELENAGGLVGCTVGGIAVALYAVEGGYFATSDTCSHGQGRLSEGWLEGHLIECPLPEARNQRCDLPHATLVDNFTGNLSAWSWTRRLPLFVSRANSMVRRTAELSLHGPSATKPPS
jgi:hypothetical protein